MFSRINYWLPEDAGGVPLKLPILSGNVSQAHTEISRSFNFTVPQSVGTVPSDYGLSPYQSGVMLEVLTSLTGSFNDTDKKCWFYGSLFQLDTEQPQQQVHRSPAIGTFKAYDPLHRATSVGVNISWATKMKIYSASFYAADFDPADPYFTVNLPDDSEDWVPEGFISLVAYITTGATDDEPMLVDYDRSMYVYAAATKILMFTQSQQFPGAPVEDSTGYLPLADFRYDFKLLYYDATDTAHTAKKLITQILTGDPNSKDGGAGFASGDLDLDEIMGFDGVTPMQVRNFVWDKSNGPASAALDKLVELGIIPVNYRIAYNPQTRKVEGRYEEQEAQDSISVVLLGSVKNDKTPFTIEAKALRVECWSKGQQPVDYALNAAVTLDTPAGYSAKGTPLAHPEAACHDGHSGTSLQFQKELTHLNYPPVATPTDCVVLDLGAIRMLSEINFRGATPRQYKGDGTTILIPVYFVSRQPKISFSLTNDPADKVGIPINPDAIGFTYDPLNPGAYADNRFQTSLVHSGRYVILRWEQDYFYRRDGNHIGAVARQSNYPVSEIRALGDGRYRYPDTDLVEPDTPANARLTDKGDVITAFNSGAKTITILPAEAAKFAVTDIIMLWDTSGGIPFVGYWTITVIAGGVITVAEALPGAIATGDQMGPWKRWMQGLTLTWFDLKAPKLYQKLLNTTRRVELITDQVPASLAEAEQLCVERLLTLNLIDRDYEAEIPLRHDINIGTTVRVRPGRKAWLVQQFQLNLPAMAALGGKEPITLNVSGNDYTGVMQ